MTPQFDSIIMIWTNITISRKILVKIYWAFFLLEQSIAFKHSDIKNLNKWIILWETHLHQCVHKMLLIYTILISIYPSKSLKLMGHFILNIMKRGVEIIRVLQAKVHETITCSHAKQSLRYPYSGTCSLKKSAVTYHNFGRIWYIIF